MSCWAGGRAPDTGGRAVAAAATGTGNGRAESVATRLPKWRPARRNSTPGPCTARHSLQKACLARGPVCRSDQQRPSAPRSLGTWTAGLRCYFRFAQSQLGRGDNPLPPTVGELCLWAQCFSNPGTFANYKAQVDKACMLLNLDRSAFSDPAVSCAKAAIRHRAPQPGPRPPPVTRKALVAMLPHVPDPQMRALLIIAFAMALRLPSEALLIRMGDRRPSTGRRFPVYPRGPGPPSADHRAFHHRWNGRPPPFQAEAHAQAERRKTRVLVQHLQGDMPSARPTLPAVWRRAWRFSVRSPSKADRRRARSPLAGGHAQSAQVGGGGGSPQCRPYHD